MRISCPVRPFLAAGALVGGLLVHAPAAAQVQLQHVGFRLGLARATQGGGFYDLVEDVGGTTEARTGFVAGAYADLGTPALDGRLSILAGLELSQKGMRIPPDGGLVKRTLDITYLEVPVLARVTFGQGEVRPFALAGPVVSFTQSTSGERNDVAIDVDDEISGTDLGVALGVGARRGALGLELRYVHGLTNISESPDPDEAARNRQWSLVASWELPVGGRGGGAGG